MRRLGALLLVLAVAPTARAEVTTDKTHRFQLDLDDGWREVPAPTDSHTPLVGFEHRKRRALMAVSRVEYPNLDAWRRRTRKAYYSEIEKGIKTSVDGYKRLRQNTTRLGRVPALDLTFRHRDKDGERVVFMRFLFFRTYSLSLSLSLPYRQYRRHKRRLRTVLHSFKPYFGD